MLLVEAPGVGVVDGPELGVEEVPGVGVVDGPELGAEEAPGADVVAGPELGAEEAPGVDVVEGPELGADEAPGVGVVEEVPGSVPVDGPASAEGALEAPAACKRSTRAACFMKLVSARHGCLLRKAFQAHVEPGCWRSFCNSFVAKSDLEELPFLSGCTRSRSFLKPRFTATSMEPPWFTERQASRVKRQRRLSTSSMAMSCKSARALSRVGSDGVVMTAERFVMLGNSCGRAHAKDNTPAFQEARVCIGLRTLR